MVWQFYEQSTPSEIQKNVLHNIWQKNVAPVPACNLCKIFIRLSEYTIGWLNTIGTDWF
jgi:hypothetical protein